MKKVLTLLMSISLVFMLAIPAFAEGAGTMDNGMYQTNQSNPYQSRDNIDMNTNGVDGEKMMTDTARNMNRTDDGDFRTTAVGDETMDWGWLGLLGLIGLAGLFNRGREQNRS